MTPCGFTRVLQTNSFVRGGISETVEPSSQNSKEQPIKVSSECYRCHIEFSRVITQVITLLQRIDKKARSQDNTADIESKVILTHVTVFQF